MNHGVRMPKFAKNYQQGMVLPLAHKIFLLVFLVLFISLFVTGVFITKKIDNILEERIGGNATTITGILSSNKEVAKFIELKQYDDLEKAVYIISDTTKADIVIYDADKKVIAEHLRESSQLHDQGDDLGQTLERIPFKDPANYLLDYTNYWQNIHDKKGEIIGYTYVNYNNDLVGKIGYETFFLIILSSLIGLMIGTIGAMWLAKNIKSTLYGLEPEMIALILEERNAMLNSVHEGIIAINNTGIITMINDQARGLLQKNDGEEILGRALEDVFPKSNLLDAIKTGKAKHSIDIMLGNTKLFTNIVPIFIKNNIAGAISTFRKKTEIERLAEELTGVKNYADALRAQTHEFMNKLHVILGLIELDLKEEVVQYVRTITGTQKIESETFSHQLVNPVLTGLIMGQKCRARELNIEFILTQDSSLPLEFEDDVVNKVILILGNLITNAMEYLTSSSNDSDDEKLIVVTIYEDSGEFTIIVENSGAAMPEHVQTNLFERGFSTKGDDRGIGMYIIKQTVQELNGEIYVDSKEGQGTIFTVKFPCEKQNDKSTIS